MAQRQEKTSQMRRTSQHHASLGDFFALFTLLTCFSNDWMTQSWLRVEILGASWGFSAWLRWSSRGPQLDQKGRQPPTNLRQGDDRAAMLPRTVHGFDQRTSQHQLVVHTSDDLRPPFGLLWGYASVASPRAEPACPAGNHARGSSATERSD